MKTRKNNSSLSKSVKKYMTKQLNCTIEDARVFKGVNLTPLRAWKHIGGASKTIEVTPYIFKYDETNDRIIALSKKRRLPCFRIDFSVEDRTIIIDISYYSDCCDNNDILLPDSNGVQIMLHAAIGALFRRRDLAKYSKICIADNSGKNVEAEKGKKSIVNLADMYFVCTGCTWYSTLIPMFLQKVPEYKAFINSRKKVIGSEALSWNDLLARVSEKCMNDLKKIREIYSKFTIDESEGGSAAKILNLIRINRTYSYIFYNYMNELIRGFNISSLYAKEWIIPLRNGKIITCNEDEVQMSCNNKGRWVVPAIFLENVNLDEWKSIMSELQEPEIVSPFGI